MKQRAFLFILIIAGAVYYPKLLCAQVIVEDAVITDTVDLFAKSEKQEKSGLLAMAASVVLPGLGQQYFGQNNKALAYFSAEALFLFGALFCDHYSKQLVLNARAFAWQHANVTGGSGANDVFWQNLAYYDESDGANQSISRGYNKQMELMYRTSEKDYLTPNLQWRWDDQQGNPVNRKIYSKELDNSKVFQVASSFFIGAMVLDRLVSFVDVRFTSLHHSSASAGSVRIVPQYIPATGSSGLTLLATF